MTCKDCVHDELCDWNRGYSCYFTLFGAENCRYYKPKSRFVELPCEVGQKVWFIDQERISFHYEWVVGETYFSLSMLNDFGKTVFLSREEAEKALQRKAVMGDGLY